MSIRFHPFNLAGFLQIKCPVKIVALHNFEAVEQMLAVEATGQ